MLMQNFAGETKRITVFWKWPIDPLDLSLGSFKQKELGLQAEVQ